MAAIDPELVTWRSIRAAYKRGGILIGNGFSINIWPRFKYKSLRDAAKQAEIKHKLRPEDDRLFDELGTDSFEQVLGALLVSIRVLKALGPARPDVVPLIAELQDRYDHIRLSLIDAVHYVHIERALIPTENLIAIWDELRLHKSVYSTNYDLIIYWAMRAWAGERQNNATSRDFMFSLNDYEGLRNTFTLSAAQRWRSMNDPRTDVFYLHGALHLYRTGSGITVKLVADDATLLQQFYEYPAGDALPLFISGGTVIEKLAQIGGSTYLDFCFAEFKRDAGPLVIIGHSLDDVDRHIVDAVASHPRRSVAIGLRRGILESETVSKMARCFQQLPDARIDFFDATTHPLTHPALRCDEQLATFTLERS